MLGGNQMSVKVKDDIASNLRARRTAQHFVRESAFNSDLKRFEEEQAARRDVESVRVEGVKRSGPSLPPPMSSVL
jgi:hypothetical protein